MTSSTNTTTTTPANHIPATAHSCSPHTLPTPSSSPLPLPNSSNISTHSQHERPSFTFTLPTRSRPSSAPAKGDTTVEHCVTLLSSVYSAKLDSPKPHVRRRRASVSTVSMKTGVRLGWLGRLVVAWMGIYMAVVGSQLPRIRMWIEGIPGKKRAQPSRFRTEIMNQSLLASLLLEKRFCLWASLPRWCGIGLLLMLYLGKCL
ncbi:hypothetical protein BC829DRAFT_253242 [Chytridium lagenaria]|nr:hypothetical protein BC829DRAFT_253242 [Chytridium lagenaria]